MDPRNLQRTRRKTPSSELPAPSLEGRIELSRRIGALRHVHQAAAPGRVMPHLGSRPRGAVPRYSPPGQDT